jgi:Tn7-like transposition protein D
VKSVYHGFVRAAAGVGNITLLPSMFRMLDDVALPTWLEAVRREPRRAWHPLKHICLQMVVDGLTPSEARGRPVGRFSRRDLSKAPELRSQAALLAAAGQSTRAIAAKMGVAWETANRMLDPRVAEPKPTPNSLSAADRKHWSSLISKYPDATRTQLRRRVPALYARLYRGDRRWLREQACASPVEVRKPLVDWLARDAGLAAEVSVRADDIGARVPAIRVTRSRILRELQRATFVAHRSRKLPKTLAVLAAQCEALVAFRVRRLTRVLLRRGTSPLISRTSLLRAARINTSGLADGGVALINAVRQGVLK